MISFLGVPFAGDGLDTNCDIRKEELFLSGDINWDESKLSNFAGFLISLSWPDLCLCLPAILSASWKYWVMFLVLLVGPAE